MTPQGCFILLTKTLKRHRLAADGKALKRYVESQVFAELIAGIPAKRRHAALTAWLQAETACQRRRPIPKRGVAKRANWRDPAFLAKFRNGCARGLDDEDLARLCCITVPAAMKARERFWERPPTQLPLAA